MDLHRGHSGSKEGPKSSFGLVLLSASSRLKNFWATTAQPCDLRQVSPTPSPFGAPVFSVGLSSLSNRKASSPIQNLRPAPACLPIAPHTLTWGPWEACDSDGVSANESGNELAAAGSQEQTHGPRQTRFLGLGRPGPDWEEDWTAAPMSTPQLLTEASRGLRCHPVVVLGTVSLCPALGPLGLWPGLVWLHIHSSTSQA